jgi:hypothetical protein
MKIVKILGSPDFKKSLTMRALMKFNGRRMLDRDEFALTLHLVQSSTVCSTNRSAFFELQTAAFRFPGRSRDFFQPHRPKMLGHIIRPDPPPEQCCTLLPAPVIQSLSHIGCPTRTCVYGIPSTECNKLITPFQGVLGLLQQQ